MKLSATWITNIHTKEVLEKVEKAYEYSAKEVIVLITNTIKTVHPWKTDTGNNTRSITFEVGPGKEIAKNKNEVAVYSTSGYGGILETGSSKMPAFPYFRPALDANIDKLPEGMKAHL